MSRNSSVKVTTRPEGGKRWKGIALPVWVLAGLVFAQVIVGLLLALMNILGVKFKGVNTSVIDATISAVIYIFTLLIVVGLPWWVRRYRTTAKELGLADAPKLVHVLWVPLAFAGYILLSSILTTIGTLTPFYDKTSVQDVGFANLTHTYEYILAFLTLVVIAPIAEEVLFRGYLLGKLRKNVSLLVSIFVTSVLFAIVHLSFNVGVDVFALSIVLCLLRVKTGSLWPSILLHMTKNGLAFYLLFINPLLFPTLGG